MLPCSACYNYVFAPWEAYSSIFHLSLKNQLVENQLNISSVVEGNLEHFVRTLTTM